MLAIHYAYSKIKDGGFAISTLEESLPRRIEGTLRIPSVNIEAWTFAPHAATSVILTNLLKHPHWYPNDNTTGKKSGEVKVEAAAVRTICNPNIMELSKKTKSVALPDLREYDVWSSKNNHHKSYTSLSLPAGFHDLQARDGNMTTLFVPPGPGMTSVTTGVLGLGPRNRTGVRLALACSVDARWHKALHRITYNDHLGIGNPGSATSADLVGRCGQPATKQSDLPIARDSWRHIAVESDALEAALGFTTLFRPGYEPYAIEHGSRCYRTTALGSIILARAVHLAEKSTPREFWRNNTNAVESVISTVFADVLSRIGSHRQRASPGHIPTESVKKCLQISSQTAFCPPPPAAETSKWTPLEFRAMTEGTLQIFSTNGIFQCLPSWTGYAYQASKATDYISIAVLAIYVVVVILHVAATGVDRRSFSSWASIEELLLLAKNSMPSNNTDRLNAKANISPLESGSSLADHDSQASEREYPCRIDPPDGLANTSSGIRSLSTMRLRMRIRADTGQREERLQMVFTDEEAAPLKPVRLRKAY